jgi:hypothetical protein
VTPGSRRRASLLVFALSAAALFWSCADRLTLNVDEGIYLDGALRVKNAEVPYRDFAMVHGPLSPWTYGAMFRAFGVSLKSARLPLILEIAAATAAVFFLTANLTTARFAAMTTFVFFAFETRDLGMIALNHRWDSGVLAFLAFVPACAALRSISRPLAFLAGVLAALAAWFTPTLGLVLAAIALCLLVWREFRPLLPAFVAGAAAVSLICVAIMAAQGALVPMIHTYVWAGTSYSAVNHVPYGFAGTGYLEAGSGLGAAGWIFYSILLIAIMTPAVLPIVTWLAWAAYFAMRRAEPQKEKPLLLLMAGSVAALASTYPRWDIGHLLYVAPIFYVLAGAFVHRVASPKSLPIVVGLLATISVIVLTPRLSVDSHPMRTAGGVVRIEAGDQALLAMLLERVAPGESLFVFPYFPTVYFLTGGINPTRYSWIYPAMMGASEEAGLIHDLAAHPPRWILYEHIPIELYLKHWPSTDPSKLHMESVEQFIRANYRTVQKLSHRLGEFVLLERNGL